MSAREYIVAKVARVPKVALLLATLFVLATGIVLFSRTDIFRSATVHQPEHFSELYFTHYKDVPKHAAQGRTYTVDFTVANHEGGDFIYRYKVEATQDGKTQLIASDTFKAHAEQAVQRHFQFSPATSGGVRLTVYLLNKQQSIDFTTEVDAQ